MRLTHGGFGKAGTAIVKPTSHKEKKWLEGEAGRASRLQARGVQRARCVPEVCTLAQSQRGAKQVEVTMRMSPKGDREHLEDLSSRAGFHSGTSPWGGEEGAAIGKWGSPRPEAPNTQQRNEIMEKQKRLVVEWVGTHSLGESGRWVGVQFLMSWSL